MNSSRKWKLLCLLMFLAMALTLNWWLRTELDYQNAKDRLVSVEFAHAMEAAGQDFLAGKLRLYVVEKFTADSIHATGRKEDAFEIWTYPYYAPKSGSVRLEKALVLAYVDTYNARMKILYERSLNRSNHQHSDIGEGEFPGMAPSPLLPTASENGQ